MEKKLKKYIKRNEQKNEKEDMTKINKKTNK